MTANEAAGWVLASEDNYVILNKRIVIRGPIYEYKFSEVPYVPVIRVKGTFYHVKYENCLPMVDYSAPIEVDENNYII